MSCGPPDSYTNFMDYTDELCMMEFTPEQTNRARCTIFHYRHDLVDGMYVDFQNMERGDTLIWDGAVGNTN